MKKLNCKEYEVFVGVDVSKNTLDIFILAEEKSDGNVKNCKNNSLNFCNKKHFHIENTEKSIKKFVKDNFKNCSDNFFEKVLFICETTGGYEYTLLNTIGNLGYDMHRANTRKVKNYIRSFGQNAKTDKLDCVAIAKYGKDRYKLLSLYEPLDNDIQSLKVIAKRHCDLKYMIVQEKTRLKSPSYKNDKLLSKSINNVIKIIEKELNILSEKIKIIIENNQELQHKFNLLITFKGVGEVTIFKLFSLLPELGKLNRKEIASLSGLAPYAFDSGKKQGRRCIFGGRQEVRRALFMSGMTSIRHNKHMKSFYDRLIKNGKKPMQALVAVMRKIVVTLNAMIRDGLEYKYN